MSEYTTHNLICALAAAARAFVAALDQRYIGPVTHRDTGDATNLCVNEVPCESNESETFDPLEAAAEPPAAKVPAKRGRKPKGKDEPPMGEPDLLGASTPAAAPVTVQDVRAAAEKALADPKKGASFVVKVLQTYGATKVSLLDPKHFSDVIEALAKTAQEDDLL